MLVNVHARCTLIKHVSVNPAPLSSVNFTCCRVNTTVERSRFLRDAASKGAWLFADYELIEYPAYLEEAKEAERKARAAAAAAAGPAADDELKARDASAAAAEL